MIIGIDIRVLGSKNHSGVQEYTENLLAAMLPLDPSIQYKLFYTSFRNGIRDYSWFHLPNVSVHQFNIPNQLLFYCSRFFGRPYVDKMVGGVDAFFSPHFIITALSPQVRRITTFHDLSFEQFPEFFSWKQWLWHQFIQPAWQARFSEKIIAVSGSTKQDLSQRYHIDPTRIITIHSGVGSQFRPLPAEAVADFKKRKNLPARYILFLGTLEPRKNIAGLIQAFDALKKMPGHDDLHLVIAGTRGWLDRGIFRQADVSSYRNVIHFYEHPHDFERLWYYNGAEFFVYPSFFEGFGFPPLEAMACGVPVIASNTSSVPEVVGDAGILVNPYYISELTLACNAVLGDSVLREDLIKKGFARAKLFTWRAAAEKTLEVIKSAIT